MANITGADENIVPSSEVLTNTETTAVQDRSSEVPSEVRIEEGYTIG